MPVTHYCWHCYGQNSEPSGQCRECGRPIEAPPGTSYTDQLLWALRHPLLGRQMMAAQVLGERREQVAAEPLRELLETGDPYLSAQALASLVAIVGVTEMQPELARLAHSGAPPVAGVALRALQASGF